MPRDVSPPPGLTRHAGPAAPGGLPAGSAPVWSLVHQGVPYRVLPFGERGDRLAVLCEAPVGAPLPAYAARRLLRAMIEARTGERVVAFGDAAGARLVWAGVRAEAGRPMAYEEWSECVGPKPWSVPPTRSTGAGRARGPGAPPPAAPAVEAVLGGLFRALATVPEVVPLLPAPGACVGPALAAALHELAEGADDPRVLRALWRRVRGMRVLDPACASGEWLCGAGWALEGVYRACLARMRSFVADLDAGRRLHRPERLADFRRTVEWADDRRHGVSAELLLREWIVRDNLYGAARSTAESARCRHALSRFVGGPGGSTPRLLLDLDCNLAVGEPRHGIGARAELRRALRAAVFPGAVEHALLDEAEAVERGLAALRRARRLRLAERAALAPAVAEVRRRRAALAAVLDALAAAAAGVVGEERGAVRRWVESHRPLHLLVRFGGGALRSGFHVVRAEG